MHTKVECAITTCTYIKDVNGRYGICNNESIVLKFRLAGDFGKGNIVFLECMHQQLPQDREIECKG